MTTYPQIIRHTMVRQEMMQTMRRDTHLFKKVVNRFGDQIINSNNTIDISIGFNAFKNACILCLCSLVMKPPNAGRSYNILYGTSFHKNYTFSIFSVINRNDSYISLIPLKLRLTFSN